MTKYFDAFKLINNLNKILFARNKNGDKNLDILNGIRVLSMFWIILGHSFFYTLRSSIVNPGVVFEFLQSFTFNFVISGAYAVDIFFWLSGFLGTYLLMAEMKKKNGKMQPFWLIYLHRFLRLVPLYMLTMLIYWFLMSIAGTGPIFFMYKEEGTKYCSKVWWTHILFINNFYEIDPKINDCMGWTWYLANDFQFFLLVPLLAWLLFHKRGLGLIFIGTYQIACFIITIVL